MGESKHNITAAPTVVVRYIGGREWLGAPFKPEKGQLGLLDASVRWSTKDLVFFDVVFLTSDGPVKLRMPGNEFEEVARE